MEAKDWGSVVTLLQQFQTKVLNEPRIGPTHISLYIAILHIANEQEFKNPISVFSKDLMKRSKISGIATYTKCIQELKEIGVIDYIPSYNPLLGSLIFLLKPDRE